MNHKTLILALVTADFAAFTAWAAYSAGPDWVTPLFTSPWTMQVGTDLAIYAVFGAIWIYTDAKERGLSPAWALTSLVGGSLGLLAYLIRRETAGAVAATGAPSPQLA